MVKGHANSVTALANLNSALAGRYTLDTVLGTGGMATVYLAHDMRHGRTVALKLLRPEIAQSIAAERFLREIQLVAKLSHPHILPLRRAGGRPLRANPAVMKVMPAGGLDAYEG